MTPEDLRKLQQSYENACKTAQDSLRLCREAEDAVSKSREVVGEGFEMKRKSQMGGT